MVPYVHNEDEVFGRLRRRSDVPGRRVAVIGSIMMVMMAGAFWFVQRDFSFGGMA